jgi:hypothetical protein
VQQAFGFIEQLLGSAAEGDSTGLAYSHAGELDECVLADNNLLDQVAVAELHLIRVVEGRDDLTASDEREPLDTVEVGVLNRHNPRLGEQLLRPVINQLPVNKAVNPVQLDAVDLLAHLFSFGFLELYELTCRFDFDMRAKDLHFIYIHGHVGDEDLGIFESLRLVYADALIEDETLIEVGIRELAAWFLNDLDVVKVDRAAQAEDGVAGEVGELVAVLGEGF